MLKNKIVTADCLTHFARFYDGYFDHCITDPPYNISGNDYKKKIVGGWKNNPKWKKKGYVPIEEKWDSFSDEEYELCLHQIIS